LLDSLLQEKMDLNQNSFEDYSQVSSMIFQAVSQGDVNAVRQYINQGGDVNICNDDDKNTLLHASVIHGSYNIAVLLLNKGADLNLKNRSDLTALQLAKKLHKDGFILSIQLSIRKRAEKELKIEKDRLIMEHITQRKSRHPGLSNLHEMTRINLENAHSLLRNLENETKRTKKLVKGLELQLSVVEGQMLVEEMNEANHNLGSSFSLGSNNAASKECVRCTVCWEVPSPLVLQCTEGHVLCEECWDRPELQLCPECRVPLDMRIRNRALESILSSSRT